MHGKQSAVFLVSLCNPMVWVSSGWEKSLDGLSKEMHGTDQK